MEKLLTKKTKRIQYGYVHLNILHFNNLSMTWKPVSEEEISKFQEKFLEALQKNRATLRGIHRDEGISIKHLSEYKNGKSIPRAKNHKKLEKYLKTKLPFYG